MGTGICSRIFARHRLFDETAYALSFRLSNVLPVLPVLPMILQHSVNRLRSETVTHGFGLLLVIILPDSIELDWDCISMV
jgi:hypothetical protein